MRQTLKAHMRVLAHQIGKLDFHGGGKNRLVRDTREGRAYALEAYGHLQAARTAQDEAQAAAHMLDAQAAYIIALRRQVDDLSKLQTRPDIGGRPSAEHLAVRLREAADEQPEGTIIARCRAAIAADAVLQNAYGDKSDNAVRRAYSNK